jgi:hypothetical protein
MLFLVFILISLAWLAEAATIAATSIGTGGETVLGWTAVTIAACAGYVFRIHISGKR